MWNGPVVSASSKDHWFKTVRIHGRGPEGSPTPAHCRPCFSLSPLENGPDRLEMKSVVSNTSPLSIGVGFLYPPNPLHFVV